MGGDLIDRSHCCHGGKLVQSISLNSSTCPVSERSVSCVPPSGSWRCMADRRIGGRTKLPTRAAEQSRASYYAIVQPSGLRVHLTSRLHAPDHSETLRSFLQHVEIAISVHGFGRDGFSVWVDPERGLVVEPYGPALRGRQTGPLRGIIVGGRNGDMLDAARRLLRDRFAGYHVADERVRLGFHPDNPVNLPSAHGVQIELPPGLRGIGDFGDQLVPSVDGLVTQVVAALVELSEMAHDLIHPLGPRSV